MSDLIKHLKSFNRKERYWLLREAVGKGAFTLSDDFSVRLSEHVGVTVPKSAFVAMDYHLDWIQMALYLVRTSDPPMPIPMDALCIPEDRQFNENQMDIDLLVAFDKNSKTHIVLLEAKMDSGWTNEQLSNKAKRLGEIFDCPENKEIADSHFVLIGTKKSNNICVDDWPDWMRPDGEPKWMELHRPSNLRKVTRYGADNKRSSAGRFLRIYP